ncbi:AMP-binding protein [Rubripirellula obstinata]|nr:AMP-binding protein [Rubripirellula obstinata]
MPQTDQPSAATMPQMIGDRALRHGHRSAISFWDESGEEISWTYRELWLRSCAVAHQLHSISNDNHGDANEQPRALLLYSPGIEFIAAFFGCQIAGWIPVPTCYPKRGREIPRLDSAARDCDPAAILADTATIESIDPSKLCEAAQSVTRISTQQPNVDDSVWIDHQTLKADPDQLAFLQYTSGSTSEPKGVKIRHRNLMSNLASIHRGFHIKMQPDDATSVDRAVFWLPFFHDMGLIGGILEPLYLGMETTLMSPGAFLQRPVRWLELISRKQAAISGAPNFAYQLCIDRISPQQTDQLDLSCWNTAFCGAEPIQPRTLQDFAARFSANGFSDRAFYPCYGLAEATLLAAGGDGPQSPTYIKVDRESLGASKPLIVDENQRGSQFQKLVSCGTAAHDTELIIVDLKSAELDSFAEVEPGSIGEIWLRGAGVTDGYWQREDTNRSQFNARLTDGRDGFCRTGDLGFIHDGHLYVTGRVKDVIILRGRNLFPQDIETTVRLSIGKDSGRSAAFPVDAPRGEALAIVAELPRGAKETEFDTIVRSIRRAVIDVHDVDPLYVLLTRQAVVPVTSSGKIRRLRCREMFDADEIKTKHRYERCSASTQVPLELPEVPSPATDDHRPSLQAATENWMTNWLVARAGIDPSEINLDKPFSDYGLDSMTAVEMSGEIEDWSGAELTPIVAWNYPTVSRLSEYIVDEIIGTTPSNL